MTANDSVGVEKRRSTTLDGAALPKSGSRQPAAGTAARLKTQNRLSPLAAIRPVLFS